MAEIPIVDHRLKNIAQTLIVSISSHSLPTLASFVGRWIDDILAIHRVFV